MFSMKNKARNTNNQQHQLAQNEREFFPFSQFTLHGITLASGDAEGGHLDALVISVLAFCFFACCLKYSGIL